MRIDIRQVELSPTRFDILKGGRIQRHLLGLFGPFERDCGVQNDAAGDVALTFGQARI